MNNGTQLENIKKQELDFVKKQEANLDTKINIVVTTIGFFITIIGTVLFANYTNLALFVKISLLIYVPLALIICLFVVFPLFSKRKKDVDKRYSLYSKQYEGITIENYLEYIEFQIKLSIKIFKFKVKLLRFLIITEVILLLAVIIVLFCNVGTK
jgi:hypothetical protein